MILNIVNGAPIREVDGKTYRADEKKLVTAPDLVIAETYIARITFGAKTHAADHLVCVEDVEAFKKRGFLGRMTTEHVVTLSAIGRNADPENATSIVYAHRNGKLWKYDEHHTPTPHSPSGYTVLGYLLPHHFGSIDPSVDMGDVDPGLDGDFGPSGPSEIREWEKIAALV